MITYQWDDAKNAVLKQTRGITFELDDEERDLIESVERGEWKPVENLEREIEKHREYARNTLRKDSRVNIRISSRDLAALRVKAAEDGIPYQTLMASVLHRYAAGRLREA